MKSKCSFILKASTALVLALLMLFGTVTTSVAAVVDNAKATAEADADTSTEAHGAEGFFAALRRNTPDLADTGKEADLAETGDGSLSTLPAGMKVYFKLNTSKWSNPSTVYAYFFTTTGWSNTSGQYTSVSSTKNTDGYFSATVPNDGKTYKSVQFRSSNSVSGGNYSKVHTPDYVWNNTVWDDNSSNWNDFTTWGSYSTKKTDSQGKIYFDNSVTQWTGNIYLVVARATDSWYFRADKMTADADAPDIYYYSMSSTFSDGYTAIGFANGGSNTISSGSDGSTFYNNASKKTTWISDYAINNSNSTYVGTPSTSGSDVGYSLVYQSGNYNYFDSTYTLYSGAGGSAKIDGFQFTAHGTATANTQATASASGNTTMTIAKSSTVTVTPVPNTGYRVKSVTLDSETGTALTAGSGGTYTYKADGSAHSIYVEYEQITHSVTRTAPTNGSLELSSTSSTSGFGTSTLTVAEGSKYWVKATPNTGYKISALTVGGSTVSAATGSTSAYTHEGTMGTSDVATSVTYAIQTFNVKKTESGATGGTVKVGSTTIGTSNTSVNYGTNYTVTVNAPTGYNVSAVSIGGTAQSITVGSSVSISGVSITADKTIAVTYAAAGTCGFSLSKSSTTLNIGATDTFTVTPNSFHNTGNAITVTSGTPSVATVSYNSSTKVATVTAVAPGTATITVSCTEGGSATFNVTVNTPTISVSDPTAKKIGDTYTITPTLTNPDTTGNGWTVVYTAADANTLAISGNSITRQKDGTCLVTASFRYNGVEKASCQFQNPPSAPTVSFADTSVASINVGGTVKRTATGGNIGSAASGVVSYSGSNDYITVASDGTVTGKKPTSSAQTVTATYTVTCGGQTTTKTATYTVNVTAPTVTLTAGSTLAIGDVMTLSASSSGATTTPTYTYSITGGGSYATLSGANLTGTAAGTVKVKATADYGNGYTLDSAEKTITVEAPSMSIADTADHSTQYLTVGTAYTKSLTNNFSGTYSATSTNADVATASVSGSTLTVTPGAKGTADITVTATKNVSASGGITGMFGLFRRILDIAATGDSEITVSETFTVNVAEAENYKLILLTANKDSNNWSTAYIYYQYKIGSSATQTVSLTNMPKIAVNNDGNNVFAYRMPIEHYNNMTLLIFNEKSTFTDSWRQTADITTKSNGYYLTTTYNGDNKRTVGTWTHPVQIPQVSITDINVAVDETATSTVTNVNNISIGKTTWSTADTDIATVTNGTVTGIDTGSTTLTAKVWAAKPYNTWTTWTMDDTTLSVIGDSSSASVTVTADDKTVATGTKSSTDGSAYADNAAAGTISADPSGSPVAHGTSVTFTATANAGYKFVGWKVNDGAIEKTSTATKTIAIRENTTVYALFDKGVNVTFKDDNGDTLKATAFTYDGNKPVTPTDPIRTGYTFTGWTSDGGTTKYAAADIPALSNPTADIIYTATYTAGTYTVTLNADGGIGGTGSVTATYDSAMPAATMPTKTGYTFLGYYDDSDPSSHGTKYYNADGSSAHVWDKDSDFTLKAFWQEITSEITVANYTDGSASDDGGYIADTGGAKITAPVTAGIDSGVTVSVQLEPGYDFAGYQFTGTNTSHIRYSVDDGETWLTPTADATITTDAINGITIKTDGTEVTGVTLKALFTIQNFTVTFGGRKSDDGTTYSDVAGAVTETGNITSGDTVPYGTSVTLTAEESVTVEGTTYNFIGWFDTASPDEDEYCYGTETTYSVTSASGDITAYARYNKVNYLTFYTSWKQNIAGGWDKTTAAPRTVTVTKQDGETVTYTYSNAAEKGEEHIISSTGTYGEGNKLLVLAGDTVKATYSALASSEVISGVFYNNAIRYSTEDEPDNLYLNRTAQGDPDSPPSDDGWPTGDDDWDYDYAVGTTLYANAAYYPTATAAVINQNFNSYPAHDGVDQNDHTVEWTVTGDYLNIDLELAAKKQIVFSDSVNAVIGSENTDNFYYINETITDLTAAAAKSSNQTNKITAANIKLYYYDATTGKFTDASGNPVANSNKVELTGSDASITKSGSDSTSTSSANGSAITFSGTMPATDVYIDLDLVVTYSFYLDSKIVSDLSAENKTKFCQVATVTATKGGSSFQSQSSSSSSVQGPNTVTAGETVTYTYSLSDTWSAYYMFVGWYKGTSSGPDYNNGLLSTKDTYTCKATGNAYVYAVGTRDLFINGSKYIIGGNTDWPDTNLKMSFDPTYYNSATGKQGRYYWEITDTMFAAASSAYNKGDGYFESNGSYYWNNNNSVGNSAFQFYDTSEKSDSNKNYWRTLHSYVNTNDDVNYGLVYPQEDNDDTSRKNRATGFIEFSESLKPGYSTPLYIYAYPGADGFSVSSTPVYPHIYVSNGYKGIDVATNGTPGNVSITVDGTASGNNGSAANSTQGKAYYNGSGWSPSCEGTVRDITIKAKNATVTFSKTTASADYKVSAFVVYNLATDSVKSYTATNTSGNTYTASVKMNNDESLYVVPVVENKEADLTVIVDSTQLNTDEWGDLIGCYAWYSTGSGTAPLYGAYPGQLMVPSDDGKSWSAKFPSKVGDNELVGITFSNYYDSTNTWIGGNTVLGGIIPTYNSITKSDSTYNKTNCKVQTYDYREPIAYYNKAKKSGADSTLLTFALKSGNGELLTWTHTDLVTTTNIKDSIGAAQYPLDFEYLTDMNGNYVDMNGDKIDGHPTPSFYVAAKGEAAYVNNAMERIFWTGKNYQTPTASVPAGTGGYGDKYTYTGYDGEVSGEFDMDHAVQWYVYDASGAYITTVLSAGFADMADDDDSMTLIAKQLDDLGYGTSGRSIAICYDQSRYCYPKSGDIANTGEGFDAYRFTGQWHMENAFSTAKVYAKVGMMTDNGEVIYDTSSSAFGSATVAVDATKLSKATSSEYFGTGTEAGEDGTVSYAYTTIIDGSKQAITLSASATNFKGWYYYNGDDELTLASTETSYSPSYSKDVTYYAMYEANAIYQYLYTGREGGTNAKSYSSAGGYLTDAEITAGNRISKDRTDFGDPEKMPGSNAVSLFKKDITWSSEISEDMLDNDAEYTMKINNATITAAKFDLTYYYPASVGGASTAVGSKDDVEYNKLINLKEDININALAGSGRVFQGWYEADNTGNSTGKLLSTAPNFGQVIIKDTYIVAVFGDSELTSNDAYEVYIDDAGVTREMYTADSGRYYNDVIVCARKNNVVANCLPDGAVVGALFVDDNGTDNTINTEKLSAYANALSASSGKSGKVSGCTVSNVFTTNLTIFGRADLSLRADYKNSVGHKYYVYAYVKIGNTYYFNTTASTGTYATYTAG